jgi:hypothetical protein
MGYEEEYLKKAKTPIIKVTVTKFLDGQIPGINAIGNNYTPEVISCDITYGFDQGSTTCSLELKTPTEVDGSYVYFTPMSRVKVEQGWNNRSTLKTTFFGFVDSVEYANPPQTLRLECRDIMKLAQDNYLINSNKKVYSATADPSELDDSGNPMGGQAAADRQVQEVITDLLYESGIPPSRLNLDFVEYPAAGSYVIGNNATAVFVYESAMEACLRICDLIGYRLWADKSGMVQCREVRPLASDTYALQYMSQQETYNNGGTWTVTQSGTLLSLSASKDDDLRNWVTVYGYGGINVTVAGESDYVPTPPTYRRTEIRSYLLDTPELVLAVASGTYIDLNRLRYTARATIEGDSRVEIGQTIQLYDSYATFGEAANYFLYDYTSHFEAGLWTMDLNLVGGVGEGAPAIGNISPIALFEYRVEGETLANGSGIYEVTLDGTQSYDPDGPFDELLFTWVISGAIIDGGLIVASGSTYTFIVFYEGVVSVTLTVLDQGTPPLSSSITKLVTISGAEGVNWKTIFVASDKYVFCSDTGGASWLQKELF